MNAELYAKLFPQQYVEKFHAAGCREDGRKFLESRALSININNIPSVNASSIVTLGDTTVVCSINLEVGAPTLMKPLEGLVHIRYTLPPTAGAHIAQTTNRSYLELEVDSMCQNLTELVSSNNIVDLTQLCIIPRKSVWNMFINIAVISDHGNTFDASVYALMHALQNTNIPATISPDEDIVYLSDQPATALKVSSDMYPLTMAFVNKRILVDPNSMEVNNAQSKISLVLNNQGQICATYLPGGQPISQVQLVECMKVAASHAGKLSKLKREYPMLIQ